MPMHDWTRVDAGIFHHFHLGWLDDIMRSLNRGLLPAGYYAMAEQLAGGLGPDVLTLRHPDESQPPAGDPAGTVALASAPPRVQFRIRAEANAYAASARSAVIRHTSHHQVIAVCEIVSPGNKSSRHALYSFVDKAATLLRAGIHLVVLDLFPPSSRDPEGIHKAIWDEVIDNDFTLPTEKPLTLASYLGGPIPEAFVEPVAVGSTLPDMPLFVTPGLYVPLPLEATYRSAWEAVPAFWRNVVSGTEPSSISTEPIEHTKP